MKQVSIENAKYRIIKEGKRFFIEEKDGSFWNRVGNIYFGYTCIVNAEADLKEILDDFETRYYA